MILNISPFKSALASITTWVLGASFNMDIAIKHISFTIAVLAGIISIINGITKLIDWIEKRKHGKS